MKKRLCIILSLVLVFVFLLSGIVYATSPSQQAKVFAEEQLRTKTAIDFLIYEYGTNAEQTLNATAGEPFEYYSIDVDKYNKDEGIEQFKQVPFYTVPIIVNNETVCDMQVYLKDGEWFLNDIGGNKCKLINAMASENNIKPNNISIIAFGSDLIFVGEKDGKIVGKSPYSSDPSVGLTNGVTVPFNIITEHFGITQNKYLKRLQTVKSQNIIGSSSTINGFPESGFHQNESIMSRFYNYTKYCLF